MQGPRPPNPGLDGWEQVPSRRREHVADHGRGIVGLVLEEGCGGRPGGPRTDTPRARRPVTRWSHATLVDSTP